MHQRTEKLPLAEASDYAEFKFGWKVVLAAAFGAGCGVTGVTVYSLTLFITPLSEAFDWSRTEVSAAKTFLTLGFVVTAPFIGYLADKVGARRIGMVSLVLLAAAMLGMTQINGNIQNFYLALFLLAIAGSLDGVSRIAGRGRLPERPMGGIVEVLRAQGVEVIGDRLPIEVHGRGPLWGGRIEVDCTESSQFASAIMLVAPLMHEPATIELKGSSFA